MGLSTRLLLEGDEERVDSFLKPHTPFAFYMRSNAKRGGLRYEGQPYQSDYFGVFNSGVLVGVLTHSWISGVQLFAAEARFIPPLAEALRLYRARHPREIECFLGSADQIEILLPLLGIPSSAFRQEKVGEGLFTLSLQKIIVPSVLEKAEIKVRQGCLADVDQLAAWRHDFNVESHGLPSGQKTYDKARAEISGRIQDGEFFILEENGRMVSFCGAGGFLPDWRGVDSVWTPSDLRGRGYARAVTAGALLMLREEGVENAVLCAVRPEAIKAYRAIGFERLADWRLDFLINPVERL